ncbi:MAG: outer membrane beta-barrel protein [Hyphomicrobiaceae bacterium]|nr:porin family protein [Hyphomicrobiaceae bacterium]
MTLKKSILAGATALLLSTVGASAADLYNKGGSIKDGYMPAETARPVSWYVRGDYTHAWQDVGSIIEAPYTTNNSLTIANTHAFGVGIGRYFSSNIRGDLTFDWGKNAAVTGLVDAAVTVPGQRQFGVKSMVGLANLYYDFDTRSRFTPYIGVGLGFSRNQTSHGRIEVSGCAIVSCDAQFEGATKTNVAGALMAGFSAKLHDRVALDAGYRFVYLGDAHTGDVQITRNPVDPLAPNSTPGLNVKDLSAHEVRVGLRVDLR